MYVANGKTSAWESYKGETMNYGIQLLNGFCLGCGLIIAALVMKLLFHISWC